MSKKVGHFDHQDTQISPQPKNFENLFTILAITFERFEINGLLKALRKALFKARLMRYHTVHFDVVENFRAKKFKKIYQKMSIFDQIS